MLSRKGRMRAFFRTIYKADFSRNLMEDPDHDDICLVYVVSVIIGLMDVSIRVVVKRHVKIFWAPYQRTANQFHVYVCI
jgi:hypothetical protein